MKVKAINQNGVPTYCSAPPDRRGKGRCNHAVHEDEDKLGYDHLESLFLDNVNKARVKIPYKEIFENSERYNLDGNQEKYFIENKVYKIDSMGTEGLSEEIVSALLDASNINNFVSYESVLINKNGSFENACVSDNFINDDTEITLEIAMDREGYDAEYLALSEMTLKDQLYFVTNIIEENFGIKSKDYLLTVIAIDSICLNTDRHVGNISILLNENAEARMAPIFDNGLSLCSDFSARNEAMGALDIDSYITNVYQTEARLFGSGNFEDYDDLVSDEWNYEPKIVIDIDKLNQSIERFIDEDKIHDKEDVERSIYALKRRLEESEGELWRRL
ncbi:hypothetical protein [Enterococcus sp. AZ180]|uniref:hypothetical protein n=1 Tax=Enterococcus sp. AZ180 TaxID=2774961 RepID=UPI003F29B3F0